MLTIQEVIKILNGEFLSDVLPYKNVSPDCGRDKMIHDLRRMGLLSNERCSQTTGRGTRCKNTAMLITSDGPRCITHSRGCSLPGDTIDS